MFIINLSKLVTTIDQTFIWHQYLFGKTAVTIKTTTETHIYFFDIEVG